MHKQVTRCFQTNGRCCQLSLNHKRHFAMMLNVHHSHKSSYKYMVWKCVLDAKNQAMKIFQSFCPRPPPVGQPNEALHFILITLRYADDTCYMAKQDQSVDPMLGCTAPNLRH